VSAADALSPRQLRRRQRHVTLHSVGLTGAEARQYASAPAALRPALRATFDAAEEILATDRSGRLAVVVFAPSLATLFALRTVLCWRDLSLVLGLLLGLVGPRVFAVDGPSVRAGVARLRHTDNAMAHVLVHTVGRVVVVRVARCRPVSP
jgi:hypothetical protein